MHDERRGRTGASSSAYGLAPMRQQGIQGSSDAPSSRDGSAASSKGVRPVVLSFVLYYLPGFRAGGPIRSIANLVEQLGDEFEFRIVTSDRDLGDTHPYPGIRLGTWMRRGNAWVMYLDSAPGRLARMRRLLRDTPHDLIYLNSFFDARFTRSVLINRLFSRAHSKPVVLAPRGEFSAGALGLKYWRKRVGISAAQLIGLYRDITWQASTQLEASEIERVMARGLRGRLGGRFIIAGNVPGARSHGAAREGDADGPQSARSRGQGPLRVCFLSRISPKKNLDFALRALCQVGAEVEFSIYGPVGDEAYWASCRSIITTLPANVHARYEGQVSHDRVPETLAQHDLFFLPTRGENYGHAIAEALSAGLPVLISDQTPWRALADAGAGWDLPLDDLQAFARRIDEMARWPQSEFDASAKRARAFASRVTAAPEIVEANRRLFLEALSG